MEAQGRSTLVHGQVAPDLLTRTSTVAVGGLTS